MSAALNGADTSAGTHPDPSIGSFVSGLSTPGRPLRVPSLSSPSPSTADVPETPVARARRPRQTHRLPQKENFNIKLRVHYLEERLAQLAPDQIDASLKQNINLEIEVRQRGLEIKKFKKLVLELERSPADRDLVAQLQERERDLEM
ncbi:hypothetical protein M405DRAFT_937922 [Rhizopogon salebrosus TDB-379]|nr:hypothetical protein M405DRAFT_937922 [Rhizopogon salebrosus TDB-379]